MKKPSQELVDAFFNWYKNDHHSRGEDHYKETITRSNFTGLTREQFFAFLNQFARDGGLVQSQGYRTAPMLMASIEANYDRFRSFIMEPFDEGFDAVQWINRLENFKGFGRGIATIYLNRIDKSRFPILNNKTANGMELFGIKLPTDLTKRYQAVRDAQRQLIDWYPVFDNFFRADSLMHFLIGEEIGKPWAQQLSGSVPKEMLGKINEPASVDVNKVSELPLQNKTPLNLILYGPPGTGKTFWARQFLKEFLVDQLKADKTVEEYRLDAVRELTWYLVIALSMYLRNKEKRYKVAEIMELSPLDKFSATKLSKDVRATLWVQLQMHPSPDSTTVKYAGRKQMYRSISHAHRLLQNGALRAGARIQARQ